MHVRVSWLLVALVSIALVAVAVNLVWMRPPSVGWFFERSLIQDTWDDPERMSGLGLVPDWLSRPHGRLTIPSLQAQEDASRRARRQLRQLRGFDRDRLGAEDRMSVQVMEWVLEDRIAGEPWRFHDFPVNQLFGVQSNLPAYMVTQHRLADARDARHYEQRLRQFPAKFDGLLELLEARRERGIHPPAFMVERVLAEMRGFISPPPREHLLYTSFRDRTEGLADLDASTRERLLAAVEAAVEGSVYPAYRALIAHFEALQALPLHDHGAWSLPEGGAYYAHMVRHHTTLDLQPEAIHALGLAEVERIGAEMASILDGAGIAQGPLAQRMAEVAALPGQVFEDSDAGREAMLETFRELVAQAEARSQPHFLRMPRARVEVRRVPEFREAGAPGAYYSAPAIDGSRPGIFFANLRSVEGLPRFAMPTLAHHEAVPGHHTQTGLQVEMDGLPTFRRLLGFSAYAEGWALYAERLAWEIGLLGDPLDDLGRLQAEMFRAVRLVVDTGLHHHRWSRERAIDYMVEHTGMDRGEVVAEVERYIVYPGQALSFKVGMQAMLDLRGEAQHRLGERFSLPGFHEAVLGGGRLPLDLLRLRVEDWIAGEAGR